MKVKLTWKKQKKTQRSSSLSGGNDDGDDVSNNIRSRRNAEEEEEEIELAHKKTQDMKQLFEKFNELSNSATGHAENENFKEAISLWKYSLYLIHTFTPLLQSERRVKPISALLNNDNNSNSSFTTESGSSEIEGSFEWLMKWNFIDERTNDDTKSISELESEFISEHQNVNTINQPQDANVHINSTQPLQNQNEINNYNRSNIEDHNSSNQTYQFLSMSRSEAWLVEFTAKIYEMLAQSFNEIGDYKNGIHSIDRAVELLPFCAYIHVTRGRLFFNASMFDLAIDSYEHALKLDPFLSIDSEIDDARNLADLSSLPSH